MHLPYTPNINISDEKQFNEILYRLFTDKDVQTDLPYEEIANNVEQQKPQLLFQETIHVWSEEAHIMHMKTMLCHISCTNLQRSGICRITNSNGSHFSLYQQVAKTEKFLLTMNSYLKLKAVNISNQTFVLSSLTL